MPKKDDPVQKLYVVHLQIIVQDTDPTALKKWVDMKARQLSTHHHDSAGMVSFGEIKHAPGEKIVNIGEWKARIQQCS